MEKFSLFQILKINTKLPNPQNCFRKPTAVTILPSFWTRFRSRR